MEKGAKRVEIGAAEGNRKEDEEDDKEEDEEDEEEEGSDGGGRERRGRGGGEEGEGGAAGEREEQTKLDQLDVEVISSASPSSNSACLSEPSIHQWSPLPQSWPGMSAPTPE